MNPTDLAVYLVTDRALCLGRLWKKWLPKPWRAAAPWFSSGKGCGYR